MRRTRRSETRLSSRDSEALRHAARRKLVRMVEKRKGMCHWMAGDAVTLRFVANSCTTSG